MRYGIFAMSRARLQELATMAAEKEAWATYSRLVREISSRDGCDRADVATIPVQIRDCGAELLRPVAA